MSNEWAASPHLTTENTHNAQQTEKNPDECKVYRLITHNFVENVYKEEKIRTRNAKNASKIKKARIQFLLKKKLLK